MKQLSFIVLAVLPLMLSAAARADVWETNQELHRRLREAQAEYERLQKEVQVQRERVATTRAHVAYLESILELVEQDREAPVLLAKLAEQARQDFSRSRQVRVIMRNPLNRREWLQDFKPTDQSAVQIAATPTGGRALTLHADKATASPMVWCPLDINKIAGKRLICTVQVRGENISTPPAQHHGGKFQLRVVTPDGVKWPWGRIGGGTFDWATVQFIADIPHDAQSVSLGLGLQAVTGRIQFRNLSIELEE